MSLFKDMYFYVFYLQINVFNIYAWELCLVIIGRVIRSRLPHVHKHILQPAPVNNGVFRGFAPAPLEGTKNFVLIFLPRNAL